MVEEPFVEEPRTLTAVDADLRTEAGLHTAAGLPRIVLRIHLALLQEQVAAQRRRMLETDFGNETADRKQADSDHDHHHTSVAAAAAVADSRRT